MFLELGKFLLRHLDSFVGLAVRLAGHGANFYRCIFEFIFDAMMFPPQACQRWQIIHAIGKSESRFPIKKLFNEPQRLRRLEIQLSLDG